LIMITEGKKPCIERAFLGKKGGTRIRKEGMDLTITKGAVSGRDGLPN